MEWTNIRFEERIFVDFFIISVADAMSNPRNIIQLRDLRVYYHVDLTFQENWIEIGVRSRMDVHILLHTVKAHYSRMVSYDCIFDDAITHLQSHTAAILRVAMELIANL